MFGYIVMMGGRWRRCGGAGRGVGEDLSQAVSS